MHVSPANNSDNIFLDVAPGKMQHYTLDIPKNHEPGTNWYHSHLHQLSYGQVSAGLSGMFIVEGLENLLSKPLQNITQHTFAMSDFPFNQLYVITHNTNINHNMSNITALNKLSEPYALSNTMSGH
jgi:FtsP/CotA-like multicopper oxidase with cupredoxin domain